VVFALAGLVGALVRTPRTSLLTSAREVVRALFQCVCSVLVRLARRFFSALLAVLRRACCFLCPLGVEAGRVLTSPRFLTASKRACGSFACSLRPLAGLLGGLRWISHT
jgi:hypothetical protein